VTATESLNGGRFTSAEPVVVREYQADAPAGYVAHWLEAREIPWRISRPADEPKVHSATAIIALGSSMSAYWNEPAWIGGECHLLASSVDAGVPVLGICFGAQVLATALGGTVTQAIEPEIGWVDPASSQPQLRGPYLAWHFDVISLPPGAQALASTPEALQAFTRGRAMGLQFHPEVTPEIWRDWGDQDPDALARHVEDPQNLQDEIAATARTSRERTFALLDWWWAWLAGRD
jgi:GMP synthase (glutamine-hydrolysing)